MMHHRTVTPVETIPSRSVVLLFLGLMFLQGFHELEHIVQVIQRFALNDPTGAGILGSWVDTEPLHFLYNGGFLFLLAVIYRRDFKHLRSREILPIVFWLMTFALCFQSYHFIEHIFKITQFIQTRVNGTPGILGNFFNLVWLHFAFNTVVYIPLVFAFFLGGFHRYVRRTLLLPQVETVQIPT